MLQCNANGAAPDNTRFLAVCSPFNLNNYKEILLCTNLLTRSNLLAVLFNICIKYKKLPISLGDRGSTVVKVLCYKSEGCWFDPIWCHWNFSLTYSFRSYYGPGVDSASNRNEYQEHFLGVKAAGA